MAAFLLRVGRLGCDKCLQAGSWSALSRAPATVAFSTKSGGSKKSQKKTLDKKQAKTYFDIEKLVQHKPFEVSPATAAAIAAATPTSQPMPTGASPEPVATTSAVEAGGTVAEASVSPQGVSYPSTAEATPVVEVPPAVEATTFAAVTEATPVVEAVAEGAVATPSEDFVEVIATETTALTGHHPLEAAIKAPDGVPPLPTTDAEATPEVVLVAAALVDAAAPEPGAEAAPVEAASELVAESAHVEAAPESVAEAAPIEVAPEPVAKHAAIEVAPEPVAKHAAIEAAPEPVAEATPVEMVPEPVAEAALVEVAAEPVTEAAPIEVALDPVAEATHKEEASEPVPEAAPVEAAPESVAEAAPIEVAPEPVAESVFIEATPEPVAKHAAIEAAPEPVAEATPIEVALDPVAEATHKEEASEPVPEAATIEVALEPVAQEVPLEVAPESLKAAYTPVESSEELVDHAPFITEAAGKELQEEVPAEPSEAHMDPIQKLFVDSIREYSSRSQATGGLVDASSEYEKALAEEIAKLQRLYGGGDLTSFPDFKFAEPKMDEVPQK